MKLAAAIVALCALLALPAHAEEPLAPLLDSGQLTIDSSIAPAEGLVPGQRTNLQIEIATSTWFTGGARIRLPEVPGLVILQTEEFANNSSERRNGQTWVVQRWTIDIYPQRAGEFSVGPIEISLKVNGGELGNLAGSAMAPAVTFSATLPEALEQADFWVAAPQFSAQQSIDRDVDALEPGEAFERKVEFLASDVQAMMLPDFSPEDIPGLAAYPGTPELSNRLNRGETRASRIQSISYVAEKPGNYTLPAEDFFWWNTRSGTLEVITLPALPVTVIGDVATEAAGETTHYREQLLGLGGLAALAALAFLLLRYRPWRALATPLRAAKAGYLALRKPGLPPQLNPDPGREQPPRTIRDNNAAG
ncbi:BatD family protein [Halioglobus maricola]|uniref:BatD family protein n=1 Tax=Halioglobus maricola TaxID=2601894 RepID=UPI001478C0A1|nr:BatD family protein [Halioglobus maricola]